MPDLNECERVLHEVHLTCQRIQIFARGVRMAVRENDTELACKLLDIIQSEFECGPSITEHALDDWRKQL